MTKPTEPDPTIRITPGHLTGDPGDPYRTETARRVRVIADALNSTTAWISRWKVEMMQPGLSAAGVARQNLILVSPGRRPVVIGTVDPVARRAELRPYRLVSDRHELRTGFPLPLTMADYRQHLDSVAALLEKLGILVGEP